MNKNRFYYKGKTVWYFTFKWIDDVMDNLGYTQLNGSFLGTEKDWKEYKEEEANGQGFGAWNVKKRHCTEEEYKFLLKHIYS